jgi:hypothetical protein
MDKIPICGVRLDALTTEKPHGTQYAQTDLEGKGLTSGNINLEHVQRAMK